MTSLAVTRTRRTAEPQGALPLGEMPGESAARRFERFHRQNPEIWRLFVRFTQERIAKGFTHYGARDILHRIRWETDVAENGEASGFRINNIHSPWYARLFHRTYPQHDGFFHTRTAKADQQ
jgi:hypothetical protein